MVMDLNNISVKMYITNIWNVGGALHKAKGITTQTKVLQGRLVNVLKNIGNLIVSRIFIHENVSSKSKVIKNNEMWSFWLKAFDFL